MKVEVLSYTYQRADKSIVLKLRPGRKWRAKAMDDYLDQLFDSPEQAASALAQRHPVPVRIEAWVPSAF